MQEILVKVEYVKEFAMNSDGKLLEINKMIDDLRYGLQDVRIQTNPYPSNHPAVRDTVEAKLRGQVEILQAELDQMRAEHQLMTEGFKVKQEDDMLHGKKEFLKLIFAKQAEMVENIFLSNQAMKRTQDF